MTQLHKQDFDVPSTVLCVNLTRILCMEWVTEYENARELWCSEWCRAETIDEPDVRIGH